jgi:MFS family permease
VLNGVLFYSSASFISLSLVVPGLIRALGGANVLVGVLSAVDNGGWMLPQLLVGASVQHRLRKLPVYQVSAILRGALFVALVAIVALADRLSHPVALAGLVILYSLYSLAAGWAAVPFQEVVAKTIPATRRGRYFGWRQLGGGVVTLLVVSPIVGAVLGSGSGWPFPQGYALLFGLACACAIGGLVCFSLVTEPLSQDVRPAGTLRDQLHLLPTLWREQVHLRRFLAYRVLSRLAAIATPFYIVYANESLGIPAGMVGEYMAIISIVLLLSNLLWSRFSDRRGNRVLLRLGAALASAAPLAALLLPALGSWLGVSVRVSAYLFAAVFVLSGLSDACMGIGVSNYVLELLPERDRPAGLGLVNTAAGVASLLPIVGGTLSDLMGYPVLFLLAAGLAVASLVVSWLLVEPRGGRTW